MPGFIKWEESESWFSANQKKFNLEEPHKRLGINWNKNGGKFAHLPFYFHNFQKSQWK